MTSPSFASRFGQILATSGVAATRSPGTFCVGLRELSLPTKEAETLSTTLWYPAGPGQKETQGCYAKTLRGRWAKGTPSPAKRKASPLVVIAHGLQGSRYDLAWLAESLAAEGYWVAAIDHPGTSARSYDSARAPRMWERARHLRGAVDALHQRPDVGPLVDTSRIVGVAHSAGAAALLSWAGIDADASRFGARFASAGPFLGASESDPRLVGLVCLAPGTGRLYLGESLKKMARPTLLVSGTDDTHTPDAFNAGHYAKHLPQSEWLSIAGAGHYSFRPIGTLYARVRSPLLCRETGEKTRLEIHEMTRARVLKFLRDQKLYR